MRTGKLQDAVTPPPGIKEEQPKHWVKKTHPQHPKEKKWTANPGYETDPAPVGNEKALAQWINDMTDWGLMMHDEVIELRDRVRELEERCPPQK